MNAKRANMALAYARARASREKWAAFARYYNTGTDAERDAAERDFRAAEDKLRTLPPLVPPGHRNWGP